MTWKGWMFWLLVVLITFAIWEWRGIRQHGVRGTLSNFFWIMLFIDWDQLRNRPRWVIWLPMFGFFLWLVLHFFTGGRF